MDLGSLERGIPEDVRSGLNWSPDKQFFFVLSVITPPSPPVEASGEPEFRQASDVEEFDGEQSEGTEQNIASDLTLFTPQMMGMEVAALVKARNSAVAAWLWRKFASDTPLAANQITIESWCGVLLDEAGDRTED